MFQGAAGWEKTYGVSAVFLMEDARVEVNEFSRISFGFLRNSCVDLYCSLPFIMFTSNIIYSKAVPAYEFCSCHKFVLLLENRFFFPCGTPTSETGNSCPISDSFWDIGFVLFISGWF